MLQGAAQPMHQTRKEALSSRPASPAPLLSKLGMCQEAQERVSEGPAQSSRSGQCRARMQLRDNQLVPGTFHPAGAQLPAAHLNSDLIAAQRYLPTSQDPAIRRTRDKAPTLSLDTRVRVAPTVLAAGADNGNCSSNSEQPAENLLTCRLRRKANVHQLVYTIKMGRRGKA